MEDKKTLGDFIRTKRKENNLSQKDLAKKLYVTESAVSKWERGLSYPDITMISGICEALNISEHELCTASEDYQQRNTDLMVKSYKSFFKKYTFITCLCYACVLVPCLIGNIVDEGRVSWFFIVLTSLMLVFSLINVPVLTKKHTALTTLGCSYVSLNLLILSGCIYSGGDWFIMAFLSVLLSFSIIFLPFVLRLEYLPPFVKENKGLIYLCANTVLTAAEVIYGVFKYGNGKDPSGIFAMLIISAIIWIYFLVIRYAKLNPFFKTAILSVSTVVWLILSNAVLTLAIDGYFSITAHFNSAANGKTNRMFLIILLSLGALFAILGVIYKLRKENANKTDK